MGERKSIAFELRYMCLRMGDRVKEREKEICLGVCVCVCVCEREREEKEITCVLWYSI